MENRVKTTLITGPSEISKSFIFQAAIYWAGEGHRVYYITPVQLESLPSKYHDRSNPSTAVFKLIRFMYLADNEALMELLVDLHTFASLPSVLLIDNLDHYTEDHSGKSGREVLLARTCAITIDAMNACSRILKKDVQICATVCTKAATHETYFGNIWHLSADDDGRTISFSKANSDKSFSFRKLQDGTLVLEDISRLLSK